MIGDQIPLNNEKWECFLLLLDILQLCTARVASVSQASFLEALISDHHMLFTRCYPSASVIPKMHYMVHFPQQIIRYNYSSRPACDNTSVTFCLKDRSLIKYMVHANGGQKFKLLYRATSRMYHIV